MRNLDTPVKQIRRKIFTEIAKIGFESTDESLIHDIESIPYNIVEERAKYRESIYRERAVASERVRLAMGLSLRPENRSVHLTDGVKASNIDEKYYEPPLMQVIPSACSACESNKYEVSNMCRGCVAHPCMLTCPKGAISMVDGKSFIDQDKCVSCGMCMVSCPFGAISDKSQIFQLSHALREGTEIIAEIAPAYINQFGEDVTPGKFRSALKQLGFSNIYEVALGADIGCISEAHHYAKEVATGNLPFLLTSCCPSWSVMAKKYFPAMIDNISQELTPMVATARIVKKEHPNAKVVFIGPCASKKLEAMRHSVRSDVDFVITFEELWGLFDAKNITPSTCEELPEETQAATAAGRGYAIAGGVAGAIENCLKEYYPDVPVHIEHAESLAECKKVLTLAKAGKIKNCMIEGMACPGGCIGGAGTNAGFAKTSKALKKYVDTSEPKLPSQELENLELN
nr:4Fe-4S dicluster domain-containing protein [uncultured Blautia sp.]